MPIRRRPESEELVNGWLVSPVREPIEGFIYQATSAGLVRKFQSRVDARTYCESHAAGVAQ